ncbi:MAG: beta-N-acetylhexosaminidase [Myxococcales bacterium]|nr:beta-N-acetylhexosaminidase [Myxococcales bacterium]
MSDYSTAVSAGQVLIAGFEGLTVPRAIMDAIGAAKLGGLILFKRNIESPKQVHALIHACQAHAPPDFPLLVSVDQEGGRVNRLNAPVLQLPPMRQFGLWDDLDFTQRAAFALSTQLRMLGFTMNYAPVLDVNTNPANPVIGDRAFGNNVEIVVRHANAFAEGAKKGAMLTCGKHFPGHGDTLLDSHLALPRVTDSVERLKTRELVPFRRLAQKLDAIMSAHILYPAIDTENPATLSCDILQSLLRGFCGFGGCVISDDLEMKAITLNYGIPEAASRAILAGCDALLIGRNTGVLEATRSHLEMRAHSDPLFATRLKDAAGRFLDLRRSVETTANQDFLEDQLQTPAVIAVQDALEARLLSS